MRKNFIYIGGINILLLFGFFIFYPQIILETLLGIGAVAFLLPGFGIDM